MTGAPDAAFRARMLSAVRYFASAPDLNDARRELAALLAYGPGAVAIFERIVNDMMATGTLPRPTLMSLRAFAIHVQRSTAPKAANPAWLDIPSDDGAADETVLLGSEDAPPADSETAEEGGGAPADAFEETDETPDVDLPKGTVCARRYIIEEPIAVGGMSTVYRAIDDRDGKVVALKVLRRSFTSDPDVVAAFEREADNAWILRDRRFVQVLAQGWVDGQPFLALEHLDGQSLGAAMKTKYATGAPWRVVRRILTDVGEAIAYAHSHGLVHADLKPGNIFILRNGDPKVLDLGAVQVVHGDARLDLERDRDMAGGALTPTYASPEMLLGAAAEPRDDVFALAVIGYELLSAGHPFERYSADRARHLDIQPKRPRGIPGYAWRMLRRGLAYRRGRRPRTMAAFIAGLHPPFPTATVAFGAIALAAVIGIAAWSHGNPDAAGRALETAAQARELTVDLLALRPLPDRPDDSLAMAVRIADSTGWQAPRDILVRRLSERLAPGRMAADPPASLARAVAALGALRDAGLLEINAAETTLSVTRTLIADLSEMVQDDGPLPAAAIIGRLEMLQEADPDAVRVIAPHLTNLLNEQRHGLRTEAERAEFDRLAAQLIERFPIVPPPISGPADPPPSPDPG